MVREVYGYRPQSGNLVINDADKFQMPEPPVEGFMPNNDVNRHLSQAIAMAGAESADAEQHVQGYVAPAVLGTSDRSRSRIRWGGHDW